MRNSLWLALLLVSVSCTSNNTLSSTSLEYLKCPTSSTDPGVPDTGAMGSDSSLFGSSSMANPNNCISNPSICGSFGASYTCNTAKGCCIENRTGHCNKSSDCQANDKPVCDLTNNICVPCSTTDKTLGNTQCSAYSSTQNDPLKEVLCIGGQCKECNSNSDCMRPGKTFCNQTTNICGGCTLNSDCPGSNICKLDPSLLATGDTLTNLGECVKATDVVFVNEASATCATGDGTQAKPLCQVKDAVATGKSYISVMGNGGAMVHLYQPVTVSTSGQRVAILGPGRDATYNSAQAVINGVTVSNGAQVTLKGIAVTNNANQPAVNCSGSATLYVQSVLISDATATPNGGIYAMSCAKVDVEKTKVTGAKGYGIYINGGSGHRVINNAFINCVSATEQGGMRLSGGLDGLFAFNTIANNSAGVVCDSTVAVTDSIVTANPILAAPQFSGSCQQARIVTNNVVLDPTYKTGSDPKLTSDPMNDTCCVDKGMPDTAMTIKDDYQPVKRPLGNGFDIGFHEAR